MSSEIAFNQKIVACISGTDNAIDDGLKEEFCRQFPNEKLFVAVFCLDEHERLFSGDVSITKGQRCSSLKTIIKNIFGEIMGQIGGIVRFVEIDSVYACIVNIPALQSRMSVKRAFRDANEAINTHFGISVKMALSSEVADLSNLYRAYNEAMTATEYFKLDTGIDTILFTDMQINTHAPQLFDVPAIDPGSFGDLILCIGNSNYPEAERRIKELIRAYIKTSGLSYVTFRYVTYEIAVSMIHTFRDSITDLQFINNIFKTSIAPVNEILSLAKHICENIKVKNVAENRRADKKGQLAEDIVKYIEKRYSDVNLSVTMISEAFGYVPPYISRIFKDIKGMGLPEYLNKKRVEEAKHLLLSTDMVLGEIAGEVGYSSDAALIRAFKKCEGVTPMVFKKDYFQE